MVASRSSGGIDRPNSATITSNVQRSPRWLQNTSSMSKGVAPNRSATAVTSGASSGGLNEIKAFRTDNFEQVATIPVGRLPHGI